MNEGIAAGEGVSGGRLYAVMRERVHRAPKRSTLVSNPASDAAAQTLSRMGFRHFKVFMASPKHRKIKFVEHFSFNMLWQQNSQKTCLCVGRETRAARIILGWHSRALLSLNTG